VVLVIDTSSPVRAGLALVHPAADGTWEAGAELPLPPGRGEELTEGARRLADVARLTGVAVALGPGSFTGLRVGVSYGLGLALGRRLPLFGLRSLELAAARARVPATGVAEAGRGRVYWQEPGGDPALGEPAGVPRQRPAAGWLREATAEALRTAGVPLLDEAELDGVGVAAARLLPQAERLAYGSVKVCYMSSPGRLEE
jgi:tRNA threonylcarbamoyladenosine biosynthesis protein TsaB